MLTKGVYSVLLGIIFLFLFAFVRPASAQKKLDQKEMGVLDARTWDFASGRLPLNGYWTYFPQKLIEPGAIEVERGAFVHFPKLLNDINLNGDGIGYATFNLLVLVPDSIKTFSFEIPQLYNAYRLWINNTLVASSGVVGTSAETTVPQWSFQKASFNAEKDTLNITLQVANFHHFKGGMRDSIYMGLPENINDHWAWSFGINLAEIIFLLIEALIFAIIYFSQRDRSVILFFTCLCLTWSVRSAFSNLYPVMMLFPDFNWYVLVKIEYITLYLGVIFSILFLDQLFKNLSTQIVTYLLVVINAFFVLFTLFSQPITFSGWINVYLTVAGIAIAYGAIIVIRALLFEQAGAWFLMLSLLCGAFVFGYDVIAYGSAAGYNLMMLHGGYMLIFLLITVSLLFHLGVFRTTVKRSDILTYNDMFK